MIIKKSSQNNQNQPQEAPSGGNIIMPKSNVIRKEDLFKNTKKEDDTKQDDAPSASKKTEPQETFEKIDISSIEFKERVERRRGDRRRGYRRIDERSLVSRAQQEAHTIKELAAREGYQNGLKKASDEIEEFKTHLSEFLDMRDEMYEEFYPHIMEIVLACTEKIIKQETTISSEILKNTITSAMAELNSEVQKTEIRVNPEDVEFAQISLPEIISSKHQDIKITIEGDETVEKGSCIIVANNGVIDANFKTQLAILQSAFGIYKGGI